MIRILYRLFCGSCGILRGVFISVGVGVFSYCFRIICVFGMWRYKDRI